MNYSFTRYLAAKKSIDDRALNRVVWARLAEQIEKRVGTPRILEAGSGTGTMLERMLGWGLVSQAVYTGIDASRENIDTALQAVPAWAERQGYSVESSGPGGLRIFRPGTAVEAHFETAELCEFIARNEAGGWDLLTAHAFLDLLDLPASLPQMLSLLKPAGLFYFSINFDGLTLLEPVFDEEFDQKITALYHRSMDERKVDGRACGDSQTGRHLFQYLHNAGAEVIEAGASDWVVFPRQGRYPDDEAYFLQHIIHFFEEALTGHPELDSRRFANWLAERQAQIERGELILVVHQLDFCGRKAGTVS